MFSEALLHVCGSIPGDIPLIPRRSGFEFGLGLLQLERFMAKTPELLDPYCASQLQTTPFQSFPSLNPKSLDADRLKLVGRGKWSMEKILKGVLWLPFSRASILAAWDTTGAVLFAKVGKCSNQQVCL